MNDIVAFLLTKQGRRAVEVFTRNVIPGCRAVTRGLVQQATVGCRWWQIVYAILVSLPYPLSTLLVWSKGVNKSSEWKTYQEMMEVTRAVIQQLETYRWSSLYSILYRNRVVECPDEVPPEEPCLRRMNASFVDSAPDGRYYTCLYTGDTIRIILSLNDDIPLGISPPPMDQNGFVFLFKLRRFPKMSYGNG